MKAVNSAIMKSINRKLVLDCIRRQPVSRAEIADQTQLTRASITQIVDGLMKEGMVVETDLVNNPGPGRRQTQLAIVENSRLVAGAIMGEGRYTISLINLKGDVLWEKRGDMGEHRPGEFLDVLTGELHAAAQPFIRDGAIVHSLGVCLPSSVGQRFGDYWRRPGVFEKTNEEIRLEIQNRLGWPTVITSGFNACALEELYFGIGMQGEENFMVLRVNETVGAGVVIQGRLFVSGRGFSPEIGHITLDRNGPPCKCGNRGCLEHYLAIPHVLKDTPFETWQDVVDRMDEDPLAKEIFGAEAELLAFEIMNLANVLDLDRVVISGALVYGGERLAAYINRFMDEQFVHRMGRDSVVCGREVNYARIAAMPAYHSIFA